MQFMPIPNDVYTWFICSRIKQAPIVIMIAEKKHKSVTGMGRENLQHT